MDVRRFGLTAIALSAILASGIAHGMFIGRWTPLPPIDNYVHRLSNVPYSVGDWRGSDRKLLDVAELDRVGIAGNVYREYRNRKSGESVSLLVVSGRPGPISVHTPDICYRDAGFEPTGQTESVVISPTTGRPRTLSKLSFRSPSPVSGQGLDVYWAWVSSAGVECPENPRVRFATEPALYKFYVIRIRPRVSAAAGSGGAAEEFLAEFLSPLELSLASGGDTPL